MNEEELSSWMTSPCLTWWTEKRSPSWALSPKGIHRIFRIKFSLKMIPWKRLGRRCGSSSKKQVMKWRSGKGKWQEDVFDQKMRFGSRANERRSEWERKVFTYRRSEERVTGSLSHTSCYRFRFLTREFVVLFMEWRSSNPLPSVLPSCVIFLLPLPLSFIILLPWYKRK